jgi:hypothetical protein
MNRNKYVTAREIMDGCPVCCKLAKESLACPECMEKICDIITRSVRECPRVAGVGEAADRGRGVVVPTRKQLYRRWESRMGHGLTDERYARWAVEAAREGWYGVKSRQELETLRLLRDRGPLSCRELASLRGVSWDEGGGVQGRLLRNLQARGLVRKLAATNGCRWLEARP